MMFSLTLSAIVVVQTVLSIPLDSIESRQTSPIAPRGGVLLVQLISEELHNNWPATIDVSFEDGSIAVGHIGWIEKNTNSASWTNNPYSVRTIDPLDNTEHVHPLDVMSGPVLLVELPVDGAGPIWFFKTSIDPVWVDLPIVLPNLNIFPLDTKTVLELRAGSNWPEWNPLEYWRWALVASRLGVLPPTPPNDSEVARLSALHGEQLWRIGFDKLSKSSRGVAAACRDLLTNVAHDEGEEFACWVIQPDFLRRLLSIITDQTATSRQVTLRALRWTEEQQPFIQWLEGVYGSKITLAMTNPTLEPTLATIVWAENDEFPIAVELPASKTIRTEVERVEPIDLSIFGPQTLETTVQWLKLQIGKQQYSHLIVPPEVVVRPPYTMLPELHPLWTLRSIRQGIPGQVQENTSTSVQVRKLLGNWELFIQCNGNASTAAIPSAITTPSQIVGLEAILIIHQETNSFVAIPPIGTSIGSNIPNDFKAIQSIHDGGWVVRVELPEAWIKNDQLAFSIIRTHGDSLQVETAPLPCVPWDINPAQIILELSEWDVVNKIPTSNQNWTIH